MCSIKKDGRVCNQAALKWVRCWYLLIEWASIKYCADAILMQVCGPTLQTENVFCPQAVAAASAQQDGHSCGAAAIH